MTIDDLIKQHSKVPGDIKITFDNGETWFQPFFISKDYLWYGLNENNERYAYENNFSKLWHLYTEPKRKVKLYKWAWKNRDGKWTDSCDFLKEAPFADRNCIRLDWSMIEVDDE